MSLRIDWESHELKQPSVFLNKMLAFSLWKFTLTLLTILMESRYALIVKVLTLSVSDLDIKVMRLLDIYWTFKNTYDLNAIV